MDENKVIIKQVVNKIGLPELYDLFVNLLLGPFIEISYSYKREYYLDFIGRNHGPEKVWNTQNNKYYLMYEWNYFQDNKYGKQKQWYPNGQLSFEYNYNKKFKTHGRCFEYYNNGNIYIVSNYINGLRYGRCIKYYSDGRICSDSYYKDGIKL